MISRNSQGKKYLSRRNTDLGIMNAKEEVEKDTICVEDNKNRLQRRRNNMIVM